MNMYGKKRFLMMHVLLTSDELISKKFIHVAINIYVLL